MRLYASACMEHTACSHCFLTGEGKRRLALYSLHPTNNVWIYKATILHKLHFEFFLALWWHVRYLDVQITNADALIILDPAA